MTDNEKRLTRELAEERKITKALAELADEMIAERAKLEGEAVRKGSIHWQTQGVAGHLERLITTSNKRRQSNNLLTRDRVQKGHTSDPHDLSQRIKKRREDLIRDGSVS